MPWSYREKYNSDPVFREKERKRNRAYKASPQGRAKTNEWQRNKYNNDPVYREKERQNIDKLNKVKRLKGRVI